MRVKISIATIALQIFCLCAFAQTPPLVYSSENTGSAFPLPVLPAFSQLPVIEPLTDPFMWSNNSGRSTNFSDWEKRRNEIKAEIEHYEIGKKPGRPSNITATYTPTTATSGNLTVIVTENGKSLTLTSAILLPSAPGPYPAIIGMNSSSGSVPATIFTSRNIARITFSHNQVTTYGNPQLTNPYYQLYPDQNLDNAGQYSAWAWGVSRIIDGLELVQASLPIDLKHIGVTGCSYAGKMALFSGAFDERIALTIAQESGGGGAPAWRVSHNIEPNGTVEKIDNTDYRWFKEDMRQFSGDNVYKLPEDHHELMAMIAPRALLVTGNTDFTWLSNKSCYVSARATHEVYKQFGIGDRFGFYIDGGHGHCAVPATQVPAMEAFVEKFLKGNTAANTDITVHPFPDVNYQRWTKWWGTNNPVLPPLPPEPAGVRIWMEAECAAVGTDWQTLTDVNASNGKYVVVNGLNSTAVAPGATGQIQFNFTIDSAAAYNLYARIDCPTANDDSYWVKLDNGSFVTYNNLTTTGWMWTRLITGANMSVGAHTITIGYREDGAKLDKILITTALPNLTEKGTEASNCTSGIPVITPGQVFMVSETERNDSTFGSVQATDPDPNTQFQTWRIIGGTGTEAFGIDIGTGKLYVKDSTLMDFESATRSYSLMLTVTDGYNKSAPQSITINLVNANDNTPVITGGQAFALDGGACSALGMVKATDPDDMNQPGYTAFQNWQIVGGDGAAIFSIDAATGMISIADLQHANLNNSSFTLMVTVSDGMHTSEPMTVVINIPNKITVCHKGQLISVSKMAAIGHLQHGDCIGTCGTQSLIAGRVAPITEDDNEPVAVSIYPNPSKGAININLGSNPLKINRIEVVDLSGRVLMQMSTNALQTVTIPAGKLKAGTYMLRMQGTKVINRQVVVQ